MDNDVPKIALIHATPLAMQPISEVFAELWPQAMRRNLLDDSLSPDLEAQGMGPLIVNRLASLVDYVIQQGAHAVLFTCSAFGPAIDAVRRAHDIPILKPNEAMYDEALDACQSLGWECRIGLLTTFAPASVSMRDELLDAVKLRDLPITVEGACAHGALEKLNAGDAPSHDALVLQAAQQLPMCDVYLVGQFSMARTQPLLARALKKPVLTSPASAIRRLQAALSVQPSNTLPSSP